MIDKIGNLNKLNPALKNKPVAKPTSSSMGSDSVTISVEAQKAAEFAGHVKTVNNTKNPERAEKIKQIKMKLENGDYDNLSGEMLSKIADRIAPSLFQ